MICPLSALIFLNVRKSFYWFIAYWTLLVVAYLLNDHLPAAHDQHIDQGFINLFFLLNLMAVSGLVYAIQYYFVGRQSLLKSAIERQNGELTKQSEQLKALDKVKSSFFTNISHEFRTPLTLILGITEKRIQAFSETTDPDNETIKRNAQRLLQLINQLLDLSKLESGEMRLQLSNGDIIQHTRLVMSLFESQARSRGIDLLFNGQPFHNSKMNEDLCLDFDSEKFETILNNLFSNAIKFTPQAGNIEVTIQNTGAFVTLVVRNSSLKLPAEQLEHLFDRFYQGSSEANRNHEGTGIGLALVKELVELHKGTIAVSATDFDISFTITMPYSNELKSTDTVALDFKEADKDRAHRTHEILRHPTANTIEAVEVLVVEDNDDLRDFIQSILKPYYKVQLAKNGREGLELAQKTVPDLIVSDIMMPEMDGIELCNKLKDDDKTDHIPVVLLTAKATQSDKLDGLSTGANDYITKPFDAEELRIRIKNLLSIREKLQLRYQSEARLKPSSVKVISVNDLFLKKVKDYIEKQLDNSALGVEDIGAELGLSRSQLHRKVKALTDQPVSTFVRNYRLYRAKELLEGGAGNVTEIAFDVGFSSQTYFSKSFAELFGKSPSHFLNRVN